MARRATAQMLQTVESEQRVDKFDHQHRPNSPQLKLAELKARGWYKYDEKTAVVRAVQPA